MLTKAQRANFQTLANAFDADDVCLIKGRRTSDGSEVALICAVSHDDEGNVLLTPFAELVSENPYVAYEPAFEAPAATNDINVN